MRIVADVVLIYANEMKGWWQHGHKVGGSMRPTCDINVLMDVTHTYEGPPIKRYFIVYSGGFKGVVFEGTPKLPSK